MSLTKVVNGQRVPVPEGQQTVIAADWAANAAAPPRVPAEITFRQLLIGLVAEGWITEAEGDAWLAGTIPAAASALVASLPEAQRFAARASIIRPSVILRADPLVAALAVAESKTEADLDTFFITYAQV